MDCVLKADIPAAQADEYVALTANVYARLPLKSTSFGNYRPLPFLPDLFKFLGVRFQVSGYTNFNGLGLTTQVPAKTVYILDQVVEFVDPYVQATTIIEVNDQIPFDLTPGAYAFYDAFINYERMAGAGYYRTPPAVWQALKVKLQHSGEDATRILAAVVRQRPDLSDLVAQW